MAATTVCAALQPRYSNLAVGCIAANLLFQRNGKLCCVHSGGYSRSEVEMVQLDRSSNLFLQCTVEGFNFFHVPYICTFLLQMVMMQKMTEMKRQACFMSYCSCWLLVAFLVFYFCLCELLTEFNFAAVKFSKCSCFCLNYSTAAYVLLELKQYACCHPQINLICTRFIFITLVVSQD